MVLFGTEYKSIKNASCFYTSRIPRVTLTRLALARQACSRLLFSAFLIAGRQPSIFFFIQGVRRDTELIPASHVSQALLPERIRGTSFGTKVVEEPLEFAMPWKCHVTSGPGHSAKCFWYSGNLATRPCRNMPLSVAERVSRDDSLPVAMPRGGVSSQPVSEHLPRARAAIRIQQAVILHVHAGYGITSTSPIDREH